MKRIAIIGAACCFCVAAASDQAVRSQNTPYKGPACVGEFCFFKSPLPTEEALIAKYGPGTPIGDVRCYTVPEQKAHVHFGTEHDVPGKIVTVFVSRARNCFPEAGKAATAKTPFPTFETKEGIRLGDRTEKVIAAYGRPSTMREGADGLGQILPRSLERQGEPFGEHVLVYDGPPNELTQAKFYIHNDKVAAIYLSCSE